MWLIRHRLTVRIALAAYAAIAIPGYGWHLLPGFGHHHGGCHHDTSRHEAGHVACHHHGDAHCHEHGSPTPRVCEAKGGSHPHILNLAQPSQVLCCDTCAICQFLAKGQLRVAFAPLVGKWGVTANSDCTAPSLRPIEVLLAYSPRAPPLAFSS